MNHTRKEKKDEGTEGKGGREGKKNKEKGTEGVGKTPLKYKFLVMALSRSASNT